MEGPAMGLLHDKTAVIHGAGGAIGGAVARAFARDGAKVFLAGRTVAKLDALAKAISATGGVAEAAQVDALDEKAVCDHADAVVRKTGRIDVLFDAVGMEDVQGTPLLDMPLDDFLHPVIRGAQARFLTARAAARHMVQQGSGVIMTIIAGPPEAIPYLGGFGAACEAIQALWRGLASELGPRGVRVLCLRSAGSPDAPDVHATFEQHAKAAGATFDEFLAEASRGTLLRRLPTVSEVADVATLMASDRASAMTGTFVDVTCGSRAG
jgi:3-oxoacyl-[acyl-carrier protein] reductase